MIGREEFLGSFSGRGYSAVKRGASDALSDGTSWEKKMNEPMLTQMPGGELTDAATYKDCLQVRTETPDDETETTKAKQRRNV